MQRSTSITICLLLAFCFVVARAADVPAASGSSAPAADAQDVLAAQEAGLVEVKFIPNDARSAQIVVASRVDRPLTLRLPAAFGAVPVLAQQQPAQTQNVGGGGGNQNCWVAREVYGVHDARWLAFRVWIENDAPAVLRHGYAACGEDVAVWLRHRPLAKAAIRPLMDLAISNRTIKSTDFAQLSVPSSGMSPAFTVFPSRNHLIRVSTVCLEYGKREPNARVPYRMVALDACSTDPRVAEVLEAMSRGMLSQKVAQAAAWHLSSGRTWEQLAGEVIDMAGGADPDVRVFSTAELVAAKQFVDAASARHPAPVSPADSASAN